MAANVENMFFANNEVPWHGLGNPIPDSDLFDIAKGIKLAGLDWEVGLKKLQTMDNEPVSHRACYRKTDGRILGVVGPRWTPLQNWEMFDWFQPWLDTKVCSLHTAGSLCDGEKVWVLAQVIDNPVMEIAKGDEVAKFILLANSHDGTMAVRAGFTSVRVVCCNTLSMAIANKASKLIRIRHSASVNTNIGLIRDIMDLANKEFEASAEQYKFLASKQVHSGDLRKYVKIVLGVDTDKPEIDLPTKTLNIITEIINTIDSGKGSDIKIIRGTYWSAYNGVAEYLSWKKGRNASNRLNSLWFNEGAVMNKLALETAISMAT